MNRIGTLIILSLGIPYGSIFALTLNKGKTLYDKGKFEEAGDYFEKKAQAKPDQSIYLFNQGLANFRNKEYQKADEAFTKALELEKENPALQSEIYEARAVARYEQGNSLISSDPEKARELWQQTQYDYNNAKNLGSTKSSERQEALRKNQSLIEDKIRNLIYKEGIEQYRNKNYQGASETFEKALHHSLPEEFDEIRYNLGNCGYKIGELLLKDSPDKTVTTWEKAIEDYEEAIQLRKEEDFPQAIKNRDLLLKKLEQLKEQLKNQKQESKDQNQKEDQDSENQNQQKQEKTDDQSGEENENKSSSEKGDKPEENKTAEDKENPKGEETKEPSDHKPEDAKNGNSQGTKEQTPAEKQPTIPGRMTREQAAQLLEQLKAFERKLPLGNLEHIRKKEEIDQRKGRNCNKDTA